MSIAINSVDSSSPVTSSGIHHLEDASNSSSIFLASITVQNIASMVPTKLNWQNYITWRNLFMPMLKRYKLFGFVNGDYVCPPVCLYDSSGSRITNPAYKI
ncbi:hypothetical protein C1H46_024932 [Malus baccata]|uniref:Retrotransposon Copia-like N-terminal domain-containing protein n=1 Tax=Malus baccata TaxID=106549 RepID=A0A540LSP4_MALBA|nr:hypothetical protein C1H46_024932 [Malus baccata]